MMLILSLKRVNLVDINEQIDINPADERHSAIATYSEKGKGKSPQSEVFRYGSFSHNTDIIQNMIDYLVSKC